MNCPICQRETLIEKTRKASKYICSSPGHAYSHTVPHDEKLPSNFIITLIHDGIQVISIDHNSYPNQDQKFWWFIRSLKQHPIAEIIAAGDHQLLPEQAYRLLNRYNNLMVFL